MYCIRFSLIFFLIIYNYFVIARIVIILKLIHNLTSNKTTFSGSLTAHLGKVVHIVRLLLIFK